MFALHKELLARCYLLGLLDLLLCCLGFGLGVFEIRKGLRKLGLFRLQIMLHGLTFLAEVLELLLYLTHPSTLLLALLTLRGRPVFGLRHRLLQGRHFSSVPYYTVTALRC